MWPQNILFFLFPAVVIILVFFMLPFMNRKKEPFGFRTGKELPTEDFDRIRAVYFRKIFLFSVPLTVSVSIINMYILNTILGSLMLGLFILLMAGIDFLFYFQGYKAVRNALGDLPEPQATEEAAEADANELPKW